MSNGLVKKLKNNYRRKKLASFSFVEELKCLKKAYGQGDGSWVVNPENLDSSSVIYSFGIGRDISLELEIISKHGAIVHAFDPTPVSLEWVAQQTVPERLVIHDYGLAAFDGDLEFQMPRKQTGAHFSPIQRYKNKSSGLYKAPVKRLSTIMRELQHQHIDLLKIDIEGGEYEAIDDFLNEDISVHQLLVEFHHNYETISLQQTVNTLSRLQSVGFKIFSISDRTYEISMIKQNLVL